MFVKNFLKFIFALSDISILLFLFNEIPSSGSHIILIVFVMFLCIFNIIDRNGYIENNILLSRSNNDNLIVLIIGLFTFILIQLIKYPYSVIFIPRYLIVISLNIFNFLFLKLLSILNISV
jgi:hypothetical protein